MASVGRFARTGPAGAPTEPHQPSCFRLLRLAATCHLSSTCHTGLTMLRQHRNGEQLPICSTVDSEADPEYARAPGSGPYFWFSSSTASISLAPLVAPSGANFRQGSGMCRGGYVHSTTTCNHDHNSQDATSELQHVGFNVTGAIAGGAKSRVRRREMPGVILTPQVSIEPPPGRLRTGPQQTNAGTWPPAIHNGNPPRGKSPSRPGA